MFTTIQHLIIAMSMLYSLFMVIGLAVYCIYELRNRISPAAFGLSLASLFWVNLAGVSMVLTLPTEQIEHLWFWPLIALGLIPLVVSRVVAIPILIQIFGEKS